MDRLQDPFVFSAAATILITIVSYVWAQVTKEQQPTKTASKAAAVAAFSLLLLTWIAHGSSSQGSPLMEPFVPE